MSGEENNNFVGWFTNARGSFFVSFAFGFLAWRTRIRNADKVRSVVRLVQTKVERLVIRHEVLICTSASLDGPSSSPRTDSEGCRVFGGNNAVLKCNRETNDFDFDHEAIRTAVMRGLSPRSRNLPKHIVGQVDDICLFLDSLAKLDDLRDFYIRDVSSSKSAATAMYGDRLYW